ncbi:MAG: acetyl-CoA hydrolase/transferase C-terminal domain-containing protein [Acidobacteriota bacterium]
MNGSDEYERKRLSAEWAPHHRKVVAPLVLWTQRLLDSIHESRAFEFRLIRTPNDPFEVAQNDRMVAINEALPMEMTSQGCARFMERKTESAWA